MTAASEQFDLPDVPLDAGVSLIEASAGTGKTYNIAGLFVRLLLEAELEARQILTVTFTDAATKELRDRIRLRLTEALTVLESSQTEDKFMATLLTKIKSGELDVTASKMRLRLALAEFDTAPIYTIHSFCQRMLADRAFECGRPFHTELAPDETELIQRVSRDYWRTEVVPNALAVTVLLGLDLSLRNEGGFNKTGPDALLSLLRPCLNHPRLEVLGPEGGAEGSRETLEESLTQVADAWKMQADAVTAWLDDKKANKLSQNAKTGYKVETVIPVLLESMTALAEGVFSPGQFADLKKFTWESIWNGITSGNRKQLEEATHCPVKGFFDLCGETWAAAELYRQSLRTEFIRHAKDRLRDLKSAEGVLGYGDLITELADALQADGGDALRAQIRGQFAAALIDEFQDTDPTQCEIFLDLFKDSDTALYLIGDPKQSIYRFRGADVFSYLHAKASAGREATLRTNWRSEPELIEAVNAVFNNRPDLPLYYPDIRFEDAQAPQPFDGARLVNHNLQPLQLWCWPGTDKDAKPDNPPHEGEVRINKTTAQKHLPEVVATAIVELLESNQAMKTNAEEKHLQPRDIAVLVKTNRQACAMKSALSRRGVPAVLNTSDSVFDSPEAVELEHVLEAVATPTHASALKLALATDMIGLDAAQLHALAEEELRMGYLAGQFADYRDRMERHGFLAMFRRLLDEQKVRASLLRFEDGERRLTNLFHLGELLHQTASEQRLNPAALARWLARQRQDGRSNDANQLRLESDEDAVKLVTIHRSKGLEYPIVFLPYTWDRRNTEKQGFTFHPEPRENPGLLQLDLGSDEVAVNRVKAAEENLADELRLLYVALTRARHRCYVVTGCIGKMQKEITGLGWLLHPELMKEVAPANKDAGVMQLNSQTLFADCQKLATHCPHIETTLLPKASPDKWTPRAGEPEAELQPREFTGEIKPAWGTHSYSSLAHATLAPADAEERPDHDARPVAMDSDTPPTGIHALPAGAHTGTCLHSIFENINYPKAAAADADTQQTVADILKQHGLEDHLSTVWPNVQHILNAPLDDSIPGFTLGALEEPARLMELEFTFHMTGVAALRLAEIFQQYSGPTLDPHFPTRLERLQFTPQDGFMRGFIDLLFRHKGRYYLLDWKSNRLGPSDAAYTPERLQGVMTTEFYTLQYHLYTLALHLHLGSRLPDYDFDQHFGGAFYIFTRGIGSETRGIFFDRPTRELVEALAAEFQLGPQTK